MTLNRPTSHFKKSKITSSYSSWPHLLSKFFPGYSALSGFRQIQRPLSFCPFGTYEQKKNKKKCLMPCNIFTVLILFCHQKLLPISIPNKLLLSCRTSSPFDDQFCWCFECLSSSPISPGRPTTISKKFYRFTPLPHRFPVEAHPPKANKYRPCATGHRRRKYIEAARRTTSQRPA